MNKLFIVLVTTLSCVSLANKGIAASGPDLYFTVTNNATQSTDFIVVEPSYHLPSCAMWSPSSPITLYAQGDNQGSNTTNDIKLDFSKCANSSDIAGTFQIHDAGGYNVCTVSYSCSMANNNCTVPTSSSNSTKIKCDVTSQSKDNKSISVNVSGNW